MQYKGLYRDCDPINQPPDTSPYAKNWEIDRKTGSLTPEKGFEITQFIPPGYQEIGSESLGETLILVLFKDGEPTNRFRIIEDNVIDRDIELPLGFTTGNRVKLIPFNSSENQLICICNDGVMPPYLVNLETGADNTNPELFLELKVPSFRLESIESNGNLQSGAYYIAVAYQIEDYTTNYVYLSRPVIINNIQPLDGYDTSYDKEKSAKSNKSIRFSLEGLDPKFNQLTLIVIRVIDNVTTAIRLNPMSYQVSESAQVRDFIYTFTGFEDYSDALVEDVLIDQPFYKKVGDITLMQNTLFACQPEAIEIDDNQMQEVANAITVKPTVNYVNLNTIEGSHKDSKALFNLPTFMPFEVYAFYITPILNSGARYKAFHIPGPVIAGATDPVSTRIGDQLKYKVVGTGSVAYNADNQITDIQMGQWENENEKYPANFPDFPGQNVRHHRMPSQFDMIKALYTTYGEDASPEYRELTTVVDTTFSSEPVPVDTKADITDFAITPSFSSSFLTRGATSGNYHEFTASARCYVKLDYNTSYFIKKSWGITATVTLIINYKITRNNGTVQQIAFLTHQVGRLGKITREGVVEGTKEMILELGDKLSMEIYCHFTNPGVSYCSLASMVKMTSSAVNANNSLKQAVLGIEVDNVNIPDELKDKIQGYEIGYAIRNTKTVLDEAPVVPDKWDRDTVDPTTYKLDILDVDSRKFRTFPFSGMVEQTAPQASFLKLTKIMKDFIGINSVYVTDYYKSTISEKDDVWGVEKINFLPGNNSASVPSNKDREATVLGQLSEEADLGGAYTKNIFLGSLCTLLSDVYMPYTNQRIVSSGFILSPEQDKSGPMFFGDAFVNMYGIRQTYQAGNPDDPATLQVRNIYVPCYSNWNIGLRAKGSQWYETFYPVSGDDWNAIIPEELSGDGIRHENYSNYYAYNRDYNVVQNLKSGFSSTKKIINKFPYRIIKGVPVTRETDYNMFRRFLPADYHESVKNMGPIEKLDNYNERLIIHHRDCLYMTRSKLRLKTDALSVTLGSGDIFEIDPQPIVDTQKGYAGIQSKWSGLVTPAGYVFADSNQVFLYTGDRLNNLSPGITNDIREGIGTPRFGFNPFNNQIYMTFLRFSGNRVTLSYVPTLSFWAFFHTYLPDNYFYTRTRFFSVYNNQFYQHNVGQPGFYYGSFYPSIFDKVFAYPQEMVMESIRWISEPEGIVPEKYALWNESQHTGYVPLVLQDSIYSQQSNVFRNRNMWEINKLDDKVDDHDQPILLDINADYDPDQANLTETVPWYNRRQLQGNYFTFRLVTRQQDLKLSHVDANVSPSHR